MEKKETKVKKVTAPKKIAEKPEAKKAGLTVSVFDVSGKEVETLELPKEIFGLKPNKTLIAQAIRVYLANQRLGTADTKGRGEIRGGGRKPWRQKGTGRARAGSTRSPHWRGGGVVHGPQPRDFSLEMPKKMKKAALMSALSDKVLGNGLVVLNEINFKEAKTKEASKMFVNLNITEKRLVTDHDFAEKEVKALRNLKNTTLMKVADLNTYEVLNTKKLLITKKGIEEIGKLLTK